METIGTVKLSVEVTSRSPRARVLVTTLSRLKEWVSLERNELFC